MVTKAARTDAILGRLVDEQLRARGLEFDENDLPSQRKTLFERQRQRSAGSTHTGSTRAAAGIDASGGTSVGIGAGDREGVDGELIHEGLHGDLETTRWEGTSWAVPIDQPFKERIRQMIGKFLPNQRRDMSRSKRVTIGLGVITACFLSWFILHGQSGSDMTNLDSATDPGVLADQVTVQTIGVLDVELQSTAKNQDKTDAISVDSDAATDDATKGLVTEPDDESVMPAPLQQAPTTMFVHIAGGVAAPGVVELSAGSRVVDAVRAAGGLLPSADADRVNLAAPLHDGLRIVVPLIGHDVPAEVPLMQPGNGSSTAPSSAATPAGNTAHGQSSGTGPININTASVTELDTLPGVGPATAAIIVSHRDQHGPFPNVDSLLEVRGIGQAKLDSIRDLVTV